MNYKLILGAAFVALIAFSACKPSEKAYRDAYENAIAARNAAENADSLVYHKIRKEMKHGKAIVDGDTLPIASQPVAITADGGGVRESLKKYSVVVGQFKQVFNARQMRLRIADHGFPGAFVVNTREPYYYVIASSHHTLEEAARAMQIAREDTVMKLRDPLPFILERNR